MDWVSSGWALLLHNDSEQCFQSVLPPLTVVMMAGASLGSSLSCGAVKPLIVNGSWLRRAKTRLQRWFLTSRVFWPIGPSWLLRKMRRSLELGQTVNTFQWTCVTPDAHCWFNTTGEPAQANRWSIEKLENIFLYRHKFILPTVQNNHNPQRLQHLNLILTASHSSDSGWCALLTKPFTLSFLVCRQYTVSGPGSKPGR